jgi:hypothetical protein
MPFSPLRAWHSLISSFTPVISETGYKWWTS